MKRLFFKPSEPSPAQPITNLLAPGRTPAPNALGALCAEIKAGEPRETTLHRYREFREATGMSQSVEDLLSFAVHKHTFNVLGPKHQNKTFARLGKLLPQPFTLKELKAHKQPPNVREQLMQSRKSLEALEHARITETQALIETNQRDQILHQTYIAQAQTEAHAHQQQIEQLAHTIGQLRESLVQQHQAQKQEQISTDATLAGHRQTIEDLTHELAHAQERLTEQEENIERERHNTRQFLMTYLSATGAPQTVRQRRHHSLLGPRSRPTSMIGERRTAPMQEQTEP